MPGKIEGRRRRGQQWARWLDGIADSVVMYLLGLDIYIYNIAPALKTSWYHYFYIITGKIGSREDLHLFKLLVNGVLFLQSGML